MIKEAVGIIGAGAMGSGIAQVAAMAGHDVVLYDLSQPALNQAGERIRSQLNKFAEKSKWSPTETESIFGRIFLTHHTSGLADCSWIIEAVLENLEVKKKVFTEIESILKEQCVIASNTSSLSISALASALKKPERFIGIHFFNPVPAMPLVELIGGLQTDSSLISRAEELMISWGKLPVVAKDTPGFIVNRIARPYYSEALRIYEEGLADFATIDYAMTSTLGFRMGPFTLMDFIGNDVNYAVTQSVWEACFFEPRYKPSYTQRNLVSAGWLGKKTGRGFYNYALPMPSPDTGNDLLLDRIRNRIMVMLFNEAMDAMYYGIASREAIETAMTRGVNYPKGLIQWAVDFGLQDCIRFMQELYDVYQEDRYRLSPGFNRLIRES